MSYSQDSVLSASSECLLVRPLNKIAVAIDARETYICLEWARWDFHLEGILKQNPSARAAPARRPGPPKTPKIGLTKSRPSPLQKCAKNGVFGRKSVHFRSICAQFCTKMTSFLRT